MYIKRCLFIISVVGCLFIFTKSSNDGNVDDTSIIDFQISFNSVIGYKRDIEEDILFYIYIPKINLKRPVYNIGSNLNNVDYNVQILDGSDISNNLLFLAAHSGGGVASYFDRLVELEIGDIILIDSKDNQRHFVVEELFYIPKSGYLEYSSSDVCNILYLITCSLEYSNRQLVVKANLTV